MKKMLLGLVFLALIAFPGRALAYTQTESTCYSQCLAYRFVWQGTYCYDVFADNCTEDNGNTIKKTIMFLKSIYNTVKSGDNIDIPFKAMFVCKPLIESCIVPNQNSCNEVCGQDQLVYAPDLSVGHPDSSFQGVYYDEQNKQLYFKLVNNGMGYAWDIDVNASSGHTPNREGIISNNQPLFSEKVEHLIYLGARNGPPKSWSDTVGDFLIEQSLNGQYLHDFKSWVVNSLDLHSDSKNYNVPNYWIKAVPFTPIQGELNRITFRADPDNLIPERAELNNTFVLDIDLRPTPARYSIETLTQKIVSGTLNTFLVNFKIKNSGEESGNANIKIYDGQNIIYQTTQNIGGKSDKSLETEVTVDYSAEANPYCGKLKQYTMVVVDEENNKTERKMALPIYMGSVNGRVDDILGKRVAGAIVKAASGQETGSSDIGYYHLKGINTLGKVTLTATKAEYSKTDTKEIEFKYGDEFNACKEGFLLFNSVNFVLKDQDVNFTVTIKDTAGNQVSANVLAANSDWRFSQIINGNGPLPGMQPGKYLFTISAPGYKTISQDVNAVPDNSQLEFTLEKLPGRSDDSGLHLITPTLLWKKSLGQGEKIISNMSDTKNGKLLVAYAVDNKAKNSNLYFIDLTTGNIIKETPAPYALGYEGDVGLDTSYNGEMVGLSANLGIKNDNEYIVRLYNSLGIEFGEKSLSKGKGGIATQMNVSPDGFYVCPGNLFNKGLHLYTRYETEGKMDYKRGSTAAAICGEHFLRNDNYIDNCKEGLCEKTISNQQVRVIGDPGENTKSTVFDSTYDDKTLVVRTYKKLYYFGATAWDKEVKSDNMYKSAAVSPGGMYTLVTEGSGSSTLLKLKVFGNTGGDKTPDFPYENVKFVFANDKGLFFAQVVLNKVEFYQIGKYDNEYQGETGITIVPPLKTTNLSIYLNGNFSPAGERSYSELDPGFMYRAETTLNLNIFGNGSNLRITKGTIFSLDQGRNPILFRGQIAADFNSPVTIYAIKFDRFDMELFRTKLNQFWRIRTLPESEYFVVQNVHTKYTVSNSPNKINVMVDSGEVKVTGDSFEQTVTTNKQISIDANNIVKEAVYINPKTYVFFTLIFLIPTAIILFIYRKSKK